MTLADRTRSPFAGLLERALPPEQRNVPAMIERAARRNPDKAHVRIGDQAITFAQCRDLAAGVAGQLAAKGIRPGDRVAIMCRNRLEFIHYFAGCLWCRAIAVPINIALRGAQLAHALNLSGSRLLVIDGNLVEHVAPLPALRSLEELWPVDALAPGTRLPAGCNLGAPPAQGEPLPLPSIDPGEPSTILFTSGTTGPSKGAICPAAQLYWWAEYQSAAMAVRSDSVVYNALPLFHINALNSFTQSLLTGASCVIGERFSASGFWRTAAETGATHTAVIGAMADMFLAQPDGQWDRAHRIRTVLASSVRADTWPRFSQRFGIPRRVGGYGSTETNLAFNSETGWATPGNMGFVADGFEAEVVDERDNPLPDGARGELVLRSRVPFAFFLGYWGMPEATVSACRNLWFHTGDLVTRDSEGRFVFCGRIKESIRRRGENISAWEVEQALLEHESIAEVAVFGVPSELSSEEVMAVVVCERGASLAPEAIIEFLEPRLARFAIPRYIEFASSLPLTDTGKIRRSDLRERGVTADTWDRERSAASAGPGSTASARARPGATASAEPPGRGPKPDD